MYSKTTDQQIVRSTFINRGKNILAKFVGGKIQQVVQKMSNDLFGLSHLFAQLYAHTKISMILLGGGANWGRVNDYLTEL